MKYFKLFEFPRLIMIENTNTGHRRIYSLYWKTRILKWKRYELVTHLDDDQAFHLALSLVAEFE